jgi:hypothetical protein
MENVKTKLIADALMANADARKLKGNIPLTITIGDREPEKENRGSGFASLQTIDRSGSVPAELLCALVAE